MIHFSDTTRVTVWKVEDKGNWSEVQFSTSRKDKKTGEYLNSSWSFVRFVGQAHQKIQDEGLNRKDRIVVKGGMSKEPYTDKEGKTVYPKNPQMVVFNWEFAESAEKQTDNDVPPVVAEDDGLPF